MIPILTFLFFSSFAASRRKSSDRRSSPRKSARSFFYTHRSFHTIRNPTNRKRIRTEKISVPRTPRTASPQTNRPRSRRPENSAKRMPDFTEWKNIPFPHFKKRVQAGFRARSPSRKPGKAADPFPKPCSSPVFSLIFHVNQYARQARPAPAYFSNIQSIQMKGQVMKL